jgi:predicted DNA-binding transcriptional regulator YafY
MGTLGHVRSKARRSPAQGRNDQIVRVLQILRDLDQLRGLDVYELANRYGTTTRTIRRDLDALEQAGFPLAFELDGARKLWRIDASGQLGKLRALLDASHYLALRVAMEPGAPMRNTSPLFAKLEDLGGKIEKALGETGRAQLRAIEACFHSYDRRPYRDSAPEVLWPLVTAISERRLCRVTYRAPGAARDKTYQVLPLKVFAYDGGLYLLCRVPRYDSVVLLNLQRLRQLRLLRTKGRPPAGFDASDFEHAAFGVFVGGPPTTYRLRFDAIAAPYIRERVWHPTQELTALRDGGVEITFTCHASVEVAAWVQGWGERVRVVAPASLRGELARLGAWLDETYRLPLPVRARTPAARARPGGRRHPAPGR